jgi:hypothetical protein
MQDMACEKTSKEGCLCLGEVWFEQHRLPRRHLPSSTSPSLTIVLRIANRELGIETWFHTAAIPM